VTEKTAKRPVRVGLVVQLPFTKIDMPKFEIPELLALGAEIIILDVSRLMHPTTDFSNVATFDSGAIRYCKAATTEELERFRTVLEGVDIVIQGASTGHISPESLPVLRFISSLHTPYVLVYRNPVPVVDTSIAQPTLAQRFARFDWRNFLLNRVPLNFLGVRAANFVIWGGRASRIPMRLVDSATREIWAAAECVQAARGAAAEVGKTVPIGTAVYLDQYFGFHPDATTRGSSWALDTEKVYPLICHAFDALERQLGLEVVIAAHPRADLRILERLFGGRRTIAGRTPELVRDCQLVMCFYSTAVNLAVLFEKPVVVMKLRELERYKTVSNAPESLAAALGTKVLHLDTVADPNFSDALRIDKPAYDAFVDRYIRSREAPDTGFAEQIVALCRSSGTTKIAGL
jgi:hypothetical protein